jgi:hypothetical protein
MGWLVTATTVECSRVGDFATIMIHPDGSAKCSFVNRHAMTKDGKKRMLHCQWPECPLVTEFCHKALTL